MKMLMLVLGLFMSLSSFAEVPEVWSRNVACEELQQTLENYGSVKVLSRVLGIKTSTTVSKEVECRFNEIPMSGFFRTKDVRSCKVGKFCSLKPEPIPHPLPCGNGVCP